MLADPAKLRISLPAALEDELTGASSEAVSLVDGLLQDATRALFATYGVHLDLDGTPVSKTLQTVQFISMIGFSSPALSGSLLLALPNAVVEATLPARDGSLADWSGELANQLLGRLKNQLLSYDTIITPSLPVVVSGDGLTLPAKTRPLTRHFSFVAACGRLFARLEMELSKQVELVRQAGGAQPASIDEGELLLF